MTEIDLIDEEPDPSPTLELTDKNSFLSGLEFPST
jgi:hypothetical protein